MQIKVVRSQPESLLGYNIFSPKLEHKCPVTAISPMIDNISCFHTVGCFLRSTKGVLYAITNTMCDLVLPVRGFSIEEKHVPFLLSNKKWSKQVKCKCHIVACDVIQIDTDSEHTGCNTDMDEIHGNANGSLTPGTEMLCNCENYNTQYSRKGDRISAGQREEKDFMIRYQINYTRRNGIMPVAKPKELNNGNKTLMSIKLVAVRINPGLQTACNNCLTESVYHGNHQHIVGRRVYKIGKLKKWYFNNMN